MSTFAKLGRAALTGWAALPKQAQKKLLGSRVKPFNFDSFHDNPQSRLLIAPTNSAGQGYEWAEARRLLSEQSAANVMLDLPSSINFPAHFRVPRQTAYLSKEWQVRFFEWVAENFSHVVIEAGSTLTGPPTQRRAAREIRKFQELGLQVAFLFHGSDIRNIDEHIAREPESPFKEMTAAQQSELRSVTKRNRGLLRQFPDLHTFVSTPDLLLDLPAAAWVPVIPDSEFVESPEEFVIGERPRVVHIPSRSVLKGTAAVRDALQPLHNSKMIDYVERAGLSRSELITEYRKADIVIDQIRLGAYGVAAAEAMALGKPVIAHVSEHTRDAVSKTAGRDLPILQARAEDLRERVESLVSELANVTLLEAAAAGPRLVREIHSASFVAEKFSTFLDEQ